MPIHQYLYIFTLLLFAFGCTSNEINLSKESETTQIDTTTPIHKKDVLNNMDRVAKWQMAHPIEGKEKRIHKLNWLYGVFYMGLYDYYTISKEMASIEEINQVGQQYEWRLRQDYFNADRLAIGQVFLDVYQSENQSLSAVNNILPQLDTIMAKNTHSQDGNPRLEKEDFWSWADALFMGPGAYARAYSITKDEKYLDYIAQQWALSKGVLYSTKDSLYYRDRGAKEESTPQKQIFWGRGNGWAIGGMVRVLAAFDEPNKLHDQIIPQYKEMAYKVLRLQQADGLWRTDLENPNFHKVGESSASSLFLYALAWGVNEGVLPKEAFYPSIIKGWKALQENVNEAGRLGNVQLVASAPGRFKASDWNNYASGAYLLAGTQVYKLLENTPFTDDYPNQSTYIQSLQKFPQYVNTGFDSAYQGNPELGVLGCADHEEEASRTNGNLVLTYATMFNSPLYDPSVSGESKADLLEKCKKVIRYMCATHKSGSVKCSDGMQWGRKWQSSWWTSRMVMGAHMVKDHLSNEEWDDVMRVLKSEADTLLNRPVPIRLVGNTSCEENAWETEVLSLAYLLLKDHPDRDAWLEKMNVFAMNTFSTSSSMTNTTLLEGKAVNDWILGPVIYDDLTIENHYAFHICYMASPLLSLSWTKYIWNHFGEEFPNTLAYRERDVYEKFMNYALWDGRVAYVGAKDWPRYIYGLFFIMPALVNQQHLHQDQEARLLEQQRFYTFAKEQELHGNGSYFGDRIIGNGFCRRPPEWETDVAACLAMSYLMHEAYDTKV
jgi:rhamnogalacturonyl hydrolase YesR